MVRRYQHVRSTLRIGSANFEDSRYRYAVKGQYTYGIPQALFRIGKGIALLESQPATPTTASLIPNWIKIGIVLMAPSNHVTIYTDGACIGNPGPGGYGVVLIQRRESP